MSLLIRRVLFQWFYIFNIFLKNYCFSGVRWWWMSGQSLTVPRRQNHTPLSNLWPYHPTHSQSLKHDAPTPLQNSLEPTMEMPLFLLKSKKQRSEETLTFFKATPWFSRQGCNLGFWSSCSEFCSIFSFTLSNRQCVGVCLKYSWSF